MKKYKEFKKRMKWFKIKKIQIKNHVFLTQYFSLFFFKKKIRYEI